MSEKHSIELTLKLPEEFVESLKTQLRASGQSTFMSATQAVMKALTLFGATAKSVRLDEPERRELEGRSQATVPIRNSGDILRACERIAGGPNSVTVEIDDGILGLMKDHARDYGFGLVDFVKQVLEQGYVTQFLETCELHPIWFSAPEWKLLTEWHGGAGIRNGGELLALLLKPISSVPEAPSPALGSSQTMHLETK